MIENYDPRVNPGNQLTLSRATEAFAPYVSAIHTLLHPVFAEGFLVELAKIPDSDPVSAPKLSTLIELVLSGETGAVVAVGVLRSSGVTAFDVGVLRSILSAGPYGRAPGAVVSSDGNVYLHWEIHRDPEVACSTRLASLFRIDPHER
jgi:hypothetical protein